jgi:hypothetical protein
VPDLDADWLIVAKLGRLQSDRNIEEQVRSAAREIVRMADRYGFSDLATVLFGGSVSANWAAMCDAMLNEFRALAGRVRISLFEVDTARFNELRKHTDARGDVDLTTHRPELGREAPPPRPSLT